MTDREDVSVEEARRLAREPSTNLELRQAVISLAAQLDATQKAIARERGARKAMTLAAQDADDDCAEWAAELARLAAKVEALTSQLEEARLFHKAANDSRERQRIRADAAEQRAQRAEEALLEVERCANGNASPEVLRRHVRRALSPTDPEEPEQL